MRIRFYLMLLMAAAVMTACGEGNVASKSNDSSGKAAAEAQQDEPAPETILDLYLGMEQGNNGYTGRDSLLESLPVIARQNYKGVWYINDDEYPQKFRCSLGLYLDRKFPSKAVFKRIEEAVDTTLASCFDSYDGIDVSSALKLREEKVPANVKQMFDYGKEAFDLWTQQMRATKSESSYEVFYESRVCLVGHKIYDKDDLATYIVEMSFSYNGSNGCTSKANFYTINKETGEILKPADIEKKYGADVLKDKLWSAYLAAQRERGYKEGQTSVSRDELLSKADGCAIINEGIMFYYLPYHIGCGADAEYNLVLDLK